MRVRACGVCCRTDLHVADGELPEPKLPLGHQIVGTVEETGERVGVPWRLDVRGVPLLRFGAQNLCDRARFTGYQLNGGFAEYAVADERFCLPVPDGYPDLQAAPLLCAGLIGWQALKAAGDGERIGLWLRRLGAHRRAGRLLAGPAGLRLHARRRRRGAGVRPVARRGVGRRRARAGAGGPRRRHHLRARR